MKGLRKLKARIWPRAKDDWYVEPEDVTLGLAAMETFRGRTWDPACGQGNVVRGLIASGLKHAFGTDKVRRTDEAWFRGEMDFLADGLVAPSGVSNIVFNAPYGRAKVAEAFIRRALPLAEHKVAAFVEARFLFGERRAQNLFAELPPTRIYYVVPRPSVPPGEYLAAGHKASGGKADYVWLVWDKAAPIGLQGGGWIQRKAA
jgi:hypothetical protein